MNSCIGDPFADSAAVNFKHPASICTALAVRAGHPSKWPLNVMIHTLPNPLASRLRASLLFSLASLSLAGCTVWKTDGPADDPEIEPGLVGSKRDGQPYFLPKAMLRLKVKAEAGGAAQEAEGTKKANVLGSRNSTTIPAPEGQSPSVKNYTVSVEKIIVPDRSQGPFYAHYSTNWAFSDDTAVKVGDNMLLETISAVTDDRTKESLDNLADAAIDFMKFQAAGGLGAASSPFLLASGTKRTWEKGKTGTQQPPYIKQLDIDVTFDPFNNADVARVEALFADETGGQREIFSPLKIHIEHKDNDKGGGLPNKIGRRSGLLFREPTTVEVMVEHNPKLARYVGGLLSDVHEDWQSNLLAVRAADKAKTKAKAALSEAQTEMNDVKTKLDAAKAKVTELEAKKKAAAGQPVVTQAMIDEEKKKLADLEAGLESGQAGVTQAKVDAAKAKVAALEAKKKAAEDATVTQEMIDAAKAKVAVLEAEFQGKKTMADQKKKISDEADEAHKELEEPTTLTGQYVDQLQKMHFGSLPGEKARDKRLTLAVPNKNRAYSVNLPRSAFISRTTELTIANGELRGIKHVKPSEIEGFTEIPKSLISKLAALPKALVDTKKDMFGAQKDALTNRNALVDQEIAFQKKQVGRDLVVETERLTQEGALTTQKIALVTGKDSLSEKERQIAAKTLPELQTENEKLMAAKAIEDSKAELAKSEAARVNEEKALLLAKRALEAEKAKGSPAPAPAPAPAGGEGNTTDPTQPPGQ